jgi:TonB family protein
VNRRPGLLVSTLVHVIVITALVERTVNAPTRPVPAGVTPAQGARAVLLPPPPALLRELARPAQPAPATPPPPPPAQAKDRISVGPRSELRQKGPLILRRDDDLTAVPRGNPQPQPPAQAAEPRPASTPVPPPSAAGSTLRLPVGGDLPQPSGSPGTERRSIASSLRNLDQHISSGAAAGIPTGTGQQMGPLFFDPQGADFTEWIQHFKNEVYRNWIVPEPALLGFKGHVELEFAVERDGRMNELRLLQSAGTPALDRAARNALVGSRLLPLPADFSPPRVTMRVIFFYNEGPGGS